jgi:hypothetical protein
MNETERLQEDINRLRDTVDTLINWLQLELGADGVRELLAKLPEPR